MRRGGAKRRGGADQATNFLNNTTPAEAFINASPYRARASRPRLSPPRLRRGILHADTDPSIPAIAVECGNVVSSGFRKIQYLRNCRLLPVDEPAVDHPVDLAIGTANLETSL